MNDAIDTTFASEAVSQFAGSVSDWVTTCVPYIVYLIGASLLVLLIWDGYKMIKGRTSKWS